VHERVLPNGRWHLVPGPLVDQFATWQQLVPPPGLVATSRRQLRRLNSQHPPMQGHTSDGPVAVVHPDTAARNGFADGDEVTVTSPYGSVRMTATCSANVHPDSVSMPHGWLDANVSQLTSEHHVDRLTGMVVQTAIPVTLRRTPD
jgi:anaerobic selenocysteine-containing dehydrogenase